MKELENIKRALRNGIIPKNQDIRYILDYQERLSIKEKQEFDKMLPIINQMISYEKPEEKALIPKRENIFLKIPFIRKICGKLQRKEELKNNEIGRGIKGNISETIETGRENYFREELNNNQQSKKETMVISDLHGDIRKWEMVKRQLMVNPNLKVIILGDAMDRGSYGVEILLEIKELSDQRRVQYLPGNHDEFAYNYIKAKNRNERIYNRAYESLKRNGGKSTIEKLDNLDNIVLEEMKRGRIQRKINLEELMNWLGRQPIQMTVRENDINYALSHAVFDTELYKFNQKFCLEEALNIELSCNNNEILNRFRNCMWYREEDKNTHYAPLSWPKGYLVVAGHTMQPSVNIHNIEKDPRKAIVYVDCGKGNLQGFNLTTNCHTQIEPGANPRISPNNIREI